MTNPYIGFLNSFNFLSLDITFVPFECVWGEHL